jgi:hypothetical protein
MPNDSHRIACPGAACHYEVLQWIAMSGAILGALASCRPASASAAAPDLKQAAGEGGVIALDSRGDFSAPFSSEDLYRGFIDQDGTQSVALYQDQTARKTVPATRNL